jgi:hypothetical protein
LLWTTTFEFNEKASWSNTGGFFVMTTLLTLYEYLFWGFFLFSLVLLGVAFIFMLVCGIIAKALSKHREEYE